MKQKPLKDLGARGSMTAKQYEKRMMEKFAHELEVPGDHPPMYAARWNKLLDLVIDLAVSHGTYERAPHVHMQSLIDEVNELRDPIATKKTTPTLKRKP